MRSAKYAILLLITVLGTFDLWHAWQRTAIPLAIDGTVECVEVRPEKHAGCDDVHLVTIDGRVWHLDPLVGKRLVRGDVIHKLAYDRTLETPRGKVQLEPSADVRGMLIVLPALLVLSIVMLWRRRETTS